ncbi:distal tail protein Dit [Clostridium botulinum]|nr:distal tail protein Dit [Clostridium botulinum]AWB30056.1 phage tail protein [Clostridium botulinum]MBY6830678.1 phage tail family protein [Clostridium botulinum]MBY6923943.1 phage tail family protein [Clostridium botulinum]MBY6940402.1 phage tail family protein [Clostridium botulinum]MBY6961199.1 phage tail family protein [Clostridium botulinum]
MFSIQFNNYNSYKDLELVVEHRPNIPAPSRNINNIYIPGKNGTLTEDLGSYEDIGIPITFGFQDKVNINNKCRQIKMWLLDKIKDCKLYFSDDIETYYKVKNVKIDNIERSIKSLGKFTVLFTCDPFGYIDEELLIIDKPISIYNEGTFESQPYIKIHGSGDISLNINNEVIKLKNINNYIELDSEIMECYKNNEALNNHMYGEFPIFKVGENKISWTGNINKIEIIPHWRCL